MKSLLLAVLFCLPATISAQVVDSTWTGTTGLWANSANWDTAAWPNNGNNNIDQYHAIVSPGGNVTLDRDIFLWDLTVNGTLSIVNDSRLWVIDEGFRGTGDLDIELGSSIRLSNQVTSGNVYSGSITGRGILWTEGLGDTVFSGEVYNVAETYLSGAGIIAESDMTMDYLWLRALLGGTGTITVDNGDLGGQLDTTMNLNGIALSRDGIAGTGTLIIQSGAELRTIDGVNEPEFGVDIVIHPGAFLYDAENFRTEIDGLVVNEGVVAVDESGKLVAQGGASGAGDWLAPDEFSQLGFYGNTYLTGQIHAGHELELGVRDGTLDGTGSEYVYEFDTNDFSTPELLLVRGTYINHHDRVLEWFRWWGDEVTGTGSITSQYCLQHPNAWVSIDRRLNQPLHIHEGFFRWTHSSVFSDSGTGVLSIEDGAVFDVEETVIGEQFHPELMIDASSFATITGRANAHGDVTNSGAFEIGSETNTAEWNMSGHDYVQQSGNTHLRNEGVLSAPTVDIRNGSLTGNGSIIGTAVIGNRAELSPGQSAGAITVDGDLITSGKVVMEVGGTAPEDSDFIDISGQMNIGGGTLQVNHINGFEPLDGQVVQLFQFGSLVGVFASIDIDPVWDTSLLYSEGLIFVADPATVESPFGLKLLDGVQVAGNLGDVVDSDDVDLQLLPSPTSNPVKQKIDAIFLGESSIVTPTSFAFQVECSMDGGDEGDVIQTVEIWDHTANIWVLIDTQAATNADSVVDGIGTGDLSRFVHPLNDEIIAKVTWTSPAFSGKPFDWSIDVDRAVWLLK